LSLKLELLELNPNDELEELELNCSDELLLELYCSLELLELYCSLEELEEELYCSDEELEELNPKLELDELKLSQPLTISLISDAVNALSYTLKSSTSKLVWPTTEDDSPMAPINAESELLGTSKKSGVEAFPTS
jgi:hypothetical protein